MPGRDGVGETTLLNAIVGVTLRFRGAIRFSGRDTAEPPPERRAQAGIGWAPQERAIFHPLSVEENLTAVARPGPWTPEKVYGMFPRLRERRRNTGDQLSGGGQQVLAVGRALVPNPRLLLLDELLSTFRRITREGGPCRRWRWSSTRTGYPTRPARR